MRSRRPYIAESEILPGRAVAQGSADNKVKAPGAGGSGDFIGIYPFEANEKKNAGDEIGVVLCGVAKAEAGGDVAAGKMAVLQGDASGRLVALPEAPGQYGTVGVFLESGAPGDYVDVQVCRGSATIAE